MQPLHAFETDDRFDVLDEGVFLAPKKGETVIASAIIAAGIIAAAAAFVAIRRFVLTGNSSDVLTGGDVYTRIFFDMSISFSFWGFALLALAVIFVVTAICVRLVTKGVPMRYSAGGEAFSFEYGGARYTYRYDEVSGVFFEPMKVLGRTRGYNVTICGAGKTRGVSVLLSQRGERTPDKTPFWLLNIRSARIRAAKAQAAPPEPERIKYWHS